MYYTPRANRLARVSVGVVFGATAALFVGMLAVLTMPAGRMAELVADPATRGVLVPLGAVVGALLGYRTRRG